MTRAIVFSGITIDADEGSKLLAAEYLPPVGRGDMVRVVEERHPAAIGIIDGLFETSPAVLHKEILWAMSKGIHVFGGAGYGALRAAELDAFGMTGVGAIYRRCRDGRVEDDDEVAVHARLVDNHWLRLSDAMVNIRETLGRAEARSVIGAPLREELEAFAKSLFYKERTFERLVDWASTLAESASAIEQLRNWLVTDSVDLMREDAGSLLEKMKHHLSGDPAPLEIAYELEPARSWLNALSKARGTATAKPHSD